MWSRVFLAERVAPACASCWFWRNEVCEREERDRAAASIAATPGEVSYREPALMATIQKVSENLENRHFIKNQFLKINFSKINFL